jgi:hypothetical protein
MQKVVGSNPISRFSRKPRHVEVFGFLGVWLGSGLKCRIGV